MADTKTTDHRDSGANLTNQRGSSRPGSITQDGKDINTPQTHDQRMQGVSTSKGNQGSDSRDYAPNKADEDRGGYGMQDTDRRPGDRDNAGPSDAQAGASPQHDSRYSKGTGQAQGSVSAQPGNEDAKIQDEHPERAGHETAEGRAHQGKGNDERGEYGRGSTDTKSES